MRTVLLLIVFLICATSFIFSQESPSQIEDSLQVSEEVKVTFKPIIVTATRSERPILQVPHAIDVIGYEEIQRAEVGLSLDEVVRSVPGIIVNNRYDLPTGDRISIRGVGSRSAFGVRGIKMIFDNIPLTIPDGTSITDNLDLGSAGIIEILRGPSSSLYGNSAGGVIHIQTQSPPSIPISYQPQFTVGSFGYQKRQDKVSGTIGRHTYHVNVNRIELDGFRDHSDADYTTLNAVGTHKISDKLELNSVFNYFDAPYRLSPSSLTKADAEMSPSKARSYVIEQGSGEQGHQGQVGITLKYSDNRTNQFETTLYGLSRSVVGAYPGTVFELDRTSGGMRSVFSKRFQVGRSQLRWTIGTDVEALNNTQVEYENESLPEGQEDVATGSTIFDLLQYGSTILDQDEKVYNIGPFTELEFSLNAKWILTLGQRFDYYKFEVDDHFMGDGSDDSGSRNMDKFSPMIGIIYRPLDFMKIYSNYSTAFQVPTTNELRNRPSGEGGFNPSLEPETMKSYELGLKGMWLERRFDYDMSFYLLEIEDMLIPYQLPGREEEYFHNAGKTQNKGAEIQFDWYPVKGLRASFAYNFMDFVFKDYEVEVSVDDTTVQRVQIEGNEVPGVPPQQLFIGATYQHKIGAYSEINLRWVNEYFANDFNGPEPGSDTPIQDFVNDSYFIVDLRLGVQRTIYDFGVELFLGFNNLFDTRYNGSVTPNAWEERFFQPAPGRNWYTGATVSFPIKK